MATTNRREALSRLALAGAAAALPPAALAGVAADPHPAWLAELVGLRERDRIGGNTDEQVEALAARMTELEEMIGQTPSRTAAGALAQLGAALEMLENDGSVNLDRDTDALKAGLDTLDGLLAGRT